MRKTGITLLVLLLLLTLLFTLNLLSKRTPATSPISHHVSPQSTEPLPKPEPLLQPEPSTIPSRSQARCWTHDYQLAREAHLQELEDYLDASSLISLPRPFEESSLCIQADERTVPHYLVRASQREIPQIRLGPVVGPHTRIRIRFCEKDTRCKPQRCAPIRRSFTDELTDELMEDNQNDAQLDEPKNPEVPSVQDADLRELRAKAKELKAIARNDSELMEAFTLRNWTLTKQQEWTCKE